MVDPGVEFAYDWVGGPTDIDIDFGATSVTFTATTSTGSPSGFFTHFTLSDLDFGPGIAGFNVSGFLRADVPRPR